MGQYYNSKIESGVQKITSKLEEKDAELSIMLGNALKDYGKKGVLYTQEQIKQKVTEIYRVNINEAKNILLEQLKKNTEQEENQILNNTNKEKVKYNSSYKKTNEVIKEFEKKIDELNKNSYIKYRNLIKMYDEEFKGRFNDRL